MERIKNEVMEQGKTRFKKLGGGTLRFGGKIIKPGQVFTAFPNEIPKSFRDLVIALDGNVAWTENENKKAELAPPVIAGNKTAYTLQPHGKSALWYDVVTVIGKDDKGEPILKVLNEKSLKKEVAEKLIEDLSK